MYSIFVLAIFAFLCFLTSFSFKKIGRKRTVVCFTAAWLLFFVFQKTAAAQIGNEDMFDSNFGHVDFIAESGSVFNATAYSSENKTSQGNFSFDRIVHIVRYFLLFVAIVAISMIIMSAFKFHLASGNAASLSDAWQTLINGAIGLLVVMVSYPAMGLLVKTIESLITGSFVKHFT